MSFDRAIERIYDVAEFMKNRDKVNTMKGIEEFANIMQDCINNNSNLWTNENLKKFNGLTKYLLLSIENGDLDFGINVIKNDLIPLLESINIKEYKIQDIDNKIDDVTKEIKDQYTHFMYPNTWRGKVPDNYLNPEELKKLTSVAAFNLEYIQHIGAKHIKPLNKLEVLNAGCGTGEGALGCATRYPDTNFTLVDISSNSLRMVKKYTKDLNLKNVKVIQDDIMTMDLEKKFDIIISTGVIHHLSKPSEGIANLKKHLKDDGIMSIMVYGEYGRFEIGLFQEALKIILDNKVDFENGIDAVRKIWDSASPAMRIKQMEWAKDIFKGEQHIVDLLLNVNENRYNVSTLNNMVENGGMRLLEFIDRETMNAVNYVKDKELKEKISKLSPIQNNALAELLHGRMSKLQCYLVKGENDFKRLSIYDDNSKNYTVHKNPYLLIKTLKSSVEDKYYINIDCKNLQEQNLEQYKDLEVNKVFLDIIELCNGENKINYIHNKLKNKLSLDKLRDLINIAVEKRYLFLHA